MTRLPTHSGGMVPLPRLPQRLASVCSGISAHPLERLVQAQIEASRPLVAPTVVDPNVGAVVLVQLRPQPKTVAGVHAPELTGVGRADGSKIEEHDAAQQTVSPEAEAILAFAVEHIPSTEPAL